MEMKGCFSSFPKKLFSDHEKLDQSHHKHFRGVSDDLATTKLILEKNLDLEKNIIWTCKNIIQINGNEGASISDNSD